MNFVESGSRKPWFDDCMGSAVTPLSVENQTHTHTLRVDVSFLDVVLYSGGGGVKCGVKFPFTTLLYILGQVDQWCDRWWFFHQRKNTNSSLVTLALTS